MNNIPWSIFRWLLAVLLCPLCLGSATASDKPNIIFILGDDQAWWDYSFMYRDEVEGPAVDSSNSIHQVAETPAIDRLADEGLAFTSGYTVPLCRPSLQSIITGTFPHQNRVSGNDLLNSSGQKVDDEPADQRIMFDQSLARTLVKRLGYRAYQTGKWWGGPFQFGGFTEGDTRDSIADRTRPPQYTGSRPSYANQGRHGDWGLMIGRVDYVNDIPNPPHPINYANTIVPMTDFIDDCVANDDPFFIWYAPFLPHTPFDPPTGLRNKYDALVSEADEANDHIAKYYANIERLDGGVGALLDHLDSAGVADNTMIIFICDNGWITNDRGGSTRSKRQPYDAGARTPIIVHWPETIKAGGAIEPQFVTQPVSVIDMVTTALAAVDLEPSAEQHGLNLMDLDAVNARDAVFCDVYAHDMASLENPEASIVARLVVKDGWKLIDFDNGSDALYRLYDTSTGAPIDPFETNNRASAEPAKVAELSALIESWYNEPKEMLWTTHLSQTQATDSIAIPDELGQSFSVNQDGYLVGINLPFEQSDPTQSITLELRELDGSGSPFGALLASSTISPDPVYQNGFRWSLFQFESPVQVATRQQLGFLVKSTSQPNIGFNVAYNAPGGYSGGKMYYSGQIEGLTWDTADFDLPFQLITANYGNRRNSNIAPDGGGLIVSADLGVKGQPVEVQASTDLSEGSWTSIASDDNLDGLVAIMESDLADRKFYRFGISSVGEAFLINPPASATLYEELFDGSGVDLNGEEPNLTTESATWAAPPNASILDDGSLSGTGSSAAWLPFTPQNGFVYTLEATLIQSSADEDQWITFGFSGANPSLTANHGSSGLLWALTRNFSNNEDQVLHANATGGTGAVDKGDYVTGANPVAMKIVLDTTQGSGNWTYDWIVDGDTKVGDAALASSYESSIGSISITKRNGTTTNSFSLLRLSRD